MFFAHSCMYYTVSIIHVHIHDFHVHPQLEMIYHEFTIIVKKVLHILDHDLFEGAK